MNQSPIKVLVVEDEPLVLMDTADQLTVRGFVVIEASNADEAIILPVKPFRYRCCFHRH